MTRDEDSASGRVKTFIATMKVIDAKKYTEFGLVIKFMSVKRPKKRIASTTKNDRE